MKAIAGVRTDPLRVVAAILIALTSLAAGPAKAAPGDLDTTFSGDGKAFARVGTARSSTIQAMARQTDGRIVVAGFSTDGTRQSITLARFNTDGSLDTRFNDTGRVAVRVDNRDGRANAIAIQPDGRIVVGGRNGTRWLVLRFTSNGRLDTTFNGTGQSAPTSFEIFRGASVSGVALQPDGKIVAAGWVYNGTGNFGPIDVAVVRYNPDGTIDTSFNSTGETGLHIDDLTSVTGTGVAIQLNGKIVVPTEQGDLIRFNANGGLDTTFGGTGRVSASAGVTFKAVAVQADGKLVGAGSLEVNPFEYLMAIARFNANGTPDTSFGGGDGLVTTSLGNSINQADGVSIQPDGKIIAAGSTGNVNDRALAIVRYLPGGGLDTAFGTLGKVQFPSLSGSDTYAHAVLVESDGSIVAAGERIRDFFSDMLVTRFDEFGDPDTKGFGIGGSVIMPAGNSAYEGATAVALQSNGRIVTAGFANNGYRSDFALARFSSNGTTDNTFNGVGSVVTSLGTDDGVALSVAVQPDGKILAGGYYAYDPSNARDAFALVRYLADGSLDTTFNGTGKVTTVVGSGGDGRAMGMALQPDGRIVLAGYGRDSKYGFVLARYNANGSLDTTFGGAFTGKVTTVFGTLDDRARAVVLQPDGKIIAAGHTETAGGIRFAVARYLANGTLDTTFNGSGKVTVPAGVTNEVAVSVALQADGRILLGGSTGSLSEVVRLTPAGAVDASFGTAGKLTFVGRPITSIVPDPNGGILLVADNYRMLRLNDNGTLDTGYGTAGSTTVPYAVDATALAGVIQPDGRLVVVGSVDDGAGYGFGLVRLLGGDTLPDPFSYTPQSAVARNATMTSNTATITGITASAPISVVNGSYSIGCTTSFTTDPGTIANGQTVCVRHTSGAGYVQSVTTTLTVGGASADFTSTTVSQALVTLNPTSLSFGSQAVATAGSPMTATLTNNGEDAAVGLSIGTLGDFVVSATTCTTALAGGANCSISIVFLPLATGGRIGELSVVAPNATIPLLGIPLVGNGIGGGPGGGSDSPDAFTFVDRFAVPVSTLTASAPVQITGLTGPAVATAIGGEWCVSSANNCACDVHPFTRDPGAVANNQFVCVRHISSPIAGNSTDTQFIVGGIGDTFTTTTIDIVPAPFAFQPATGVVPATQLVSSAAIISGINAPSPVSVAGGEYSVGCTGTWTSTAGTVANGQTVCVRHVAASGYSAVTSTTLTIGGVTGSFVSTTASATTIPRLGNISTRMQVLTGNDVLIGGFIIGGNQPKTVVVRARGPSLAAFGITNFLANPQLQLYSGQAVLASNDDWGQAANAAAVQSSGFAPENALEAAILVTLQPGAYTAIVSGAGGVTGVGIVEVFEVDLPEVPLANISTRGQVLTGNDVMIGGFVIQGNAPQTVIVRARGPSLAEFGITNALADPVLQLFSGQAVIAANDDWQASTDAPSIQSRGFAPANSKEAAILITLNPGAYTAIVTGKAGGTGVGIIEVFAQ